MEKIGNFELDKIYCQDCLEGMRGIPDNSVHMILTDPPYGIDYEPKSEKFEKIKGDDSIDIRFIKENVRILKEGGAFYLFTRWDVYPEWMQALRDAGLTIKNCLIWDRELNGLGDLEGAYAPSYDMIIFCTKGRHILRGGYRFRDVFRAMKVGGDELVHPTQKPLKVLRTLIKNSTDPGDIVFDGYMGSGATALASKQLNRRFIGFEIELKYQEGAMRRLSQATLIQQDWFQDNLKGGDKDGNSKTANIGMLGQERWESNVKGDMPSLTLNQTERDR